MKLTTKGRYGLAVIVLLSKNKGQTVSLLSISSQLGLSKIYLEQVLAVLKSHQLVQSIKGSAGGYSLKVKTDLNVYDILSVLEPNLSAQEISETSQSALDRVLDQMVYQPLNKAVEDQLKAIMITDLSQLLNDESMYYI